MKRSYIKRKYGKTKTIKKKGVGYYKKQLWRIFSTFIRTRDKWTCFTCNRIASGSGMHAGHYIPRSAGGMGLYFHEFNVHAQCIRCNLNLSGNTDIYLQNLITKYGQEKVNELRRIRQEITPSWTEEEYKVKIEYYKEEVRKLENVKKRTNRKQTDT